MALHCATRCYARAYHVLHCTTKFFSKFLRMCDLQNAIRFARECKMAEDAGIT